MFGSLKDKHFYLPNKIQSCIFGLLSKVSLFNEVYNTPSSEAVKWDKLVKYSEYCYHSDPAELKMIPELDLKWMWSTQNYSGKNFFASKKTFCAYKLDKCLW